MKRAIAIIVVLLVVAGAIGGYYYYTQQANQNKDTLEVSGNIEATEVNIGTLAPGTVKELKFEEGDEVKKDDVVATMDPPTQTTAGPTGQVTITPASVSLKSPIAGTIMSRPFEVGEIVTAGATLFTVADLSKVTLVVYVPEDQLGKIKIGKSADVSVDSFPNKTFKGTIKKISDQAEFTPANVQTKEQRVNLVFATTITIDNADKELKPGMPADASISIK